jgi:hypothetical protein
MKFGKRRDSRKGWMSYKRGGAQEFFVVVPMYRICVILAFWRNERTTRQNGYSTCPTHTCKDEEGRQRFLFPLQGVPLMRVRGGAEAIQSGFVLLRGLTRVFWDQKRAFDKKMANKNGGCTTSECVRNREKTRGILSCDIGPQVSKPRKREKPVEELLAVQNFQSLSASIAQGTIFVGDMRTSQGLRDEGSYI